MSFDIAMSGIQAIDQELNQISNNIANAGTYGFKSSRDNFAALYADGKPNGTSIGSTTQSMSLAGGILNTGNGKNAAINGDGFFVSKNLAGLTSYSRVGIFGVDTGGFVTNTAGDRIQGTTITPPSTVAGPVGDLKIPTGQIPAVASTKLAFVGNMSADWTVPVDAATWVSPVAASADGTTPAVLADTQSYNYTNSSDIYDSQGVKHQMTQYFVKSPTANQVDVHYVVDGTEAPGSPQSLTFSSQGQLVTPDPTTPIVLTGIPSNNGADAINITFNYSGTTLFAGSPSATTHQADGYASGNYNGITIGADGSIVAKYSNNQTQTVGRLSIATFANENGLIPVNNTSWTATPESGVANLNDPGVGQAGTLTTDALEQSNVDITAELVSLISTQNNYQANSKVIQTESTMLQSLMQAVQ